MSGMDQGIVLLAAIVAAVCLTFLVNPLPNNNVVTNNNYGRATRNTSITGKDVAHIMNKANEQPRMSKAINTTNWFLKDKKFFNQEVEHIIGTPKFMKSYNETIQQFMVGMPDDQLLVDLQGPRNPTITGRFNQNATGVREAGVVTSAGIDVSARTRRWRDPRDDTTNVKMFNKKQ